MIGRQLMISSRLTTHARLAPVTFVLSAFVLVACSLSTATRAQELVLPPQPAPPPMRYVPDAERAQLEGVHDPRERVRTTLALLEVRLASAERNTGASRFDAAAADLGIYQGLIEDVLQFLKPVGRSPDGAKVNTGTRDLYKHIELALNQHTARIEGVRRQTPVDYQRNVRDTFLYVRDRRTDCLDAFFGANVTRESRDKKPAEPPDKEHP
jgi:hypothetical protein